MHVGRPMVRALRAAAFTAVCILASAALHLLVGGTPIKPEALATAVAATWVSAYALGFRERGWPAVLTLCGVSQYGLHQLFAAQEYTASALMIPTAGASEGHEHGTGAGMLVIHVAVALGSSWWLARGEMALAALLCLAAARVSGVWSLLVTVPACIPVTKHPGLAPVWPETARRVPVLLVRVVSRRGPPESLPCG